MYGLCQVGVCMGGGAMVCSRRVCGVGCVMVGWNMCHVSVRGYVCEGGVSV